VKGGLYLIPTPLGDYSDASHLPPALIDRVRSLEYFIAENAKTARAFLKLVGVSKPIATLRIEEIDSDTPAARLDQLLQPILRGMNAGLVSEAGAPAVADPGAKLVQHAHAADIRVLPMVGPSAILLALMASGLNGQQFAFLGYLPIEDAALSAKLREIENTSRHTHQTQIFIETPYRNDRLLKALLKQCDPHTQLCVATQLTVADESVITRNISAWRAQPLSIGKRPTVFLLNAG
jgi:16S rRNA (cytidine1402-2'-O)-methyltransferase